MDSPEPAEYGMPQFDDRVVVVRADGTEYPETWATVTPRLIVLPRTDWIVEEGDTVIRKLSKLPDETYLIVEANLYPRPRGMRPHYQLKVEKQTRFKRTATSSAAPIYNLIGPGSRVTVNSSDNSVNVVNVNNSELFERIKAAVREGVEGPERARLMDAVEVLSATPPGPSFLQRYGDFVQLAANHMTLLQPFMLSLLQVGLASTAQ